ncbi:MAG: lactate utilization protein [Candidatus Rokubacteria bacterium]|nr:lactate utilization protein [Candidatus Rokubacteria bacterium]
MTTRAEFLGRLRREMARTGGLFPATSAERPADPAAAAEAVRRRVAERWPAALETFRAELERVGGRFYRAAGMNDLPAVVSRIAREGDVRRVLTWSGLGLRAALSAAGLEVVEEPAATVSEEERTHLREIAAQAAIGVTGVDLAVAETGSLVVISGPGKARGVSLLPPYHVAIFGKGALVETLEQVGVLLEALHRNPNENLTGASITFITGPSRTADIELTLTRGVHGPREVHAIFVESL